MKKLGLLTMVGFLLMLTACSGWQTKTTAGYVSATALITTAENTVKPACDANSFPADKCDQLKTMYGQIRQGIIAAGNTAILSFTVTDAVQQKTLMTQYQTLMTAVEANVAEYINLYTTIASTPQGRAQLKYAISPDLLQIIIAAIEAIINNLPSIISAINSWTVASVDVPALTAQIQAAEAALPIW